VRAFALEPADLLLGVMSGQFRSLQHHILLGGMREEDEAHLPDGGSVGAVHRWLAFGGAWVVLLAT
jgi:hypothetical protein